MIWMTFDLLSFRLVEKFCVFLIWFRKAGSQVCFRSPPPPTPPPPHMPPIKEHRRRREDRSKMSTTMENGSCWLLAEVFKRGLVYLSDNVCVNSHRFKHSSIKVHWERFQESRKFWTECGVTVVFIYTRILTGSVLETEFESKVRVSFLAMMLPFVLPDPAFRVGKLLNNMLNTTSYLKTRWTLASDLITCWTLASDLITRWTLVSDWITRWILASDLITCWAIASDLTTRWTLASDLVTRWTLASDLITRWTLTSDLITCWTLANYLITCWTPASDLITRWTLVSDLITCWTLASELITCWTLAYQGQTQVITSQVTIWSTVLLMVHSPENCPIGYLSLGLIMALLEPKGR